MPLPGGRGPRFDGDLVDQREALDERRLRLSATGGLYVTNFPAYLQLEDQAHTADELTLYKIPEVLVNTPLKYARMRITTTAAAESANVAIYQYHPGVNRRFTRVPNSTAKFDGAAMGLQSIAFSQAALLVPGVPYYIGYFQSSATLGVASCPFTGIGNLIRPLSRTGVTEFPNVLGVSEVDPKGPQSPPAIAYTTEEGEIVA